MAAAVAGGRASSAVVVVAWALARKVRVERRRVLAKSMVVVGWRVLSISERLWGLVLEKKNVINLKEMNRMKSNCSAKSSIYALLA